MLFNEPQVGTWYQWESTARTNQWVARCDRGMVEEDALVYGFCVPCILYGTNN